MWKGRQSPAVLSCHAVLFYWTTTTRRPQTLTILYIYCTGGTQCPSRKSTCRGLWELMTIWLSWLSGRVLAAQARDVMGLTPGDCQPFHFSLFLPQLIYVPKLFPLWFILLLTCYPSSLDWDKYKWTGIGDEGATALADVLRLTKSFKMLK